MKSNYQKVNYAILSFLLPFLIVNIAASTLRKKSFENDSQLLWVYLSKENMTKGSQINYSKRTRSRLEKVGWQRNRTDFRVNKKAVRDIALHVDTVRQTSRFLRAVSVEADYNQYKKLLNLNIVKRIEPVATYIQKVKDNSTDSRTKLAKTESYAESYEQLAQISIPSLHDRNITGKGVRIALIDAGFDKTHPAFDRIIHNNRLVAEHDFIFGDKNVTNENQEDSVWNQDGHGTSVWSLIGGYQPGEFMGGAYNAEFVLAKTERIKYERRVEEDNFIAAVEWADSLGVDIISSSLGYRKFDNFEYLYSDLDGKTARTTKAINWAHSRGIVCVISAGNEDDDIDTDGGLTSPADAPGAISVGAVNSLGNLTEFSSHGPTAEDSIKPEVCARGNYVFVAESNPSEEDLYGRGDGTSYAAPLITAGCALLLEKFPGWGPDKLLQEIKNYASNADNPTDTTGWGIPNFHKTYYENADEFIPQKPVKDKQIVSFPNPVNKNTVLYFKQNELFADNKARMIVTNILGQQVYSKNINSELPKWNLKNSKGQRVANGIYFIRIKIKDKPDKFGKVTVVR